MKSTKRPPRSMGELMAESKQYAMETFASTPFHLPAGDTFEKSAEAIIAALVKAWAAGYAARAEERGK